MPELTPERFAAFLQGTVLDDISIRSVTADRFVDRLPDRIEMQYGDASSLNSCEHGKAIIDATYGVRLVESGSDADEALAMLEVTLRATYEVPETMDAEIFEQFRKVTLRIHTVSFAREWFRDMSSRMGLDPIILPLALAHPAASRPPGKKPKSK